MKTRKLAAKDFKTVEDFLSPHETQCMFICNNLRKAGLTFNNARFEGHYWGCFDDSEIKLNGIIAHYWNGNVMMWAPEKGTLNDLTVHFMKDLQHPIGGVIGMANQVSYVLDTLKVSENNYIINRQEGLYEIDLSYLNKLSLPPSFRLVLAKEIPQNLILQWMIEYEVEALGGEKNLDLQKKAQNKAEELANGDCWVLLKCNIPVSLCAFNARLSSKVQVGPVWTPPEYRNNGFAKLILGYVLTEARAQGIRKAVLFTDNPYAIRLYESLGFKMIGDYHLSLLKSPIHFIL